MLNSQASYPHPDAPHALQDAGLMAHPTAIIMGFQITISEYQHYRFSSLPLYLFIVLFLCLSVAYIYIICIRERSIISYIINMFMSVHMCTWVHFVMVL